MHLHWEQGDPITLYSLQAFYTEKMGDVFWRHLLVRVAYLQGLRQLARVGPEEFGFVRPEQKLSLGPNEAELLRTYRSKLPQIL